MLIKYIFGMFSLIHIIIIIMLSCLVILGIIFVNKKINNDKSLHILLVILASALLFLEIITRASDIVHSVNEGATINVFGQERPYNYWMFLPNSFCSSIALTLPFFIFFKKYRNSKYIDAIISMSILGMVTNIFYPEYLGRLPFFEARTWGAILYHTIMGFLALVLLTKRIVSYELKNWYYTPIILCIFITIGLFEITCLNFSTAFNIEGPLVAGFFLSNWYFLVLGYILMDVLLRLLVYLIRLTRERNNIEV